MRVLFFSKERERRKGGVMYYRRTVVFVQRVFLSLPLAFSRKTFFFYEMMERGLFCFSLLPFQYFMLVSAVAVSLCLYVYMSCYSSSFSPSSLLPFFPFLSFLLSHFSKHCLPQIQKLLLFIFSLFFLKEYVEEAACAYASGFASGDGVDEWGYRWTLDVSLFLRLSSSLHDSFFAVLTPFWASCTIRTTPTLPLSSLPLSLFPFARRGPLLLPFESSIVAHHSHIIIIIIHLQKSPPVTRFSF